MYSSVGSRHQFNTLPEHAQLELLGGNCWVPQIPFECPTGRQRELFYRALLWVESLAPAGRSSAFSLKSRLLRSRPDFFNPLAERCSVEERILRWRD